MSFLPLVMKLNIIWDFILMMNIILFMSYFVYESKHMTGLAYTSQEIAITFLTQLISKLEWYQ